MIMSLHGDYDPQNIFALILRGDAPCYKIYEDADVLASLDIFPQSRGHVLVIPKACQARNILAVEPAVLGAIVFVVKRLTRVVVNELKPDSSEERREGKSVSVRVDTGGRCVIKKYRE